MLHLKNQGEKIKQNSRKMEERKSKKNFQLILESQHKLADK